MNQATRPASTALTSADEADITDYLIQHPDFLSRNPAALKAQHIPHETGQAVSLLEHQARLLRRDTAAAEKQLKELIAVARENDQLNARMHALTLALIEAQDLDALVNTIHDELHSQFQADAVELKLFSHDEIETHDSDPGLTVFKDFMAADQPTCGQLKTEQLQSLFGEQIGSNGSAALIPIKTKTLVGIMAIGSRDKNRFHPGMAVDFLIRLSELVSLALQSVATSGE